MDQLYVGSIGWYLMLASKQGLRPFAYQEGSIKNIFKYLWLQGLSCLALFTQWYCIHPHLTFCSNKYEREISLNFFVLARNNVEIAKQMSNPPPDSGDLYFPTRFSQNGWEQFKACLWKQHWSYWRSPSYNLMRILLTFTASILFGILFWDQGKKL